MDVVSPRISLPSEWSVQRGGRYILLRITWMCRSSWPMPNDFLSLPSHLVADEDLVALVRPILRTDLDLTVT